MAYEKQTWNTGDVITQEKLNHMENGIADGSNGGTMLITLSPIQIGMEFSKTFAEIKEALVNGIIPVVVVTLGSTTNMMFVCTADASSAPLEVVTVDLQGDAVVATCDNETDCPVIQN